MDTGIVFGANEFIISVVLALVLVVIFFRPSKKNNKDEK